MIKIDPLVFLFLIEAAGVFFALAIIFFIRGRRYRKLYDQALSATPSEAPGDTVIEPVPLVPEPDFEDQISAVVAENDEPMPQNMRKLLEIIDFQKQKILDMLCMRDMLDDAHKQLEMLRQKNIDLENRIVSLVAASAKPEEFGEVSSLIATSNQELGNYISVLQRNSIVLGSKMEEWEGELRILWQEARKIAEELPAGEQIVVETASGEVAALQEKLRESDEKLAVAQDELKKMVAQYEDIEKEYMILYSKQQAAEAEAAKGN